MFFAIISSIIIAITAVTVTAFHLSPRQIYFVRGVLMNQELTPSQRNEQVFSDLPELSEWQVFHFDQDEDQGTVSPNIPNLLYITHEQWAKKQAAEFKILHYHKCRDLALEDLEFSSRIGLMKSASRYNGKIKFTDFSAIYVKSELLRTLTAHLSMTACLSQKERMRAKTTTENSGVETTYPIIIRHDRQTVSAIFQPQVEIQHKEFYRSVWDFVETFDPLTKYVVRSKYDSEFKVRKSNTQIAEMMSCSEETVRKAVNLFSREYLAGKTVRDFCSSESPNMPK